MRTILRFIIFAAVLGALYCDRAIAQSSTFPPSSNAATATALAAAPSLCEP